LPNGGDVIQAGSRSTADDSRDFGNVTVDGGQC